MSSKPGVVSYEYRAKASKAVATEVKQVEVKELEKAIAEEIQVEDPVNAKEIVESKKKKKEVVNEPKDADVRGEDSTVVEPEVQV